MPNAIPNIINIFWWDTVNDVTRAVDTGVTWGQGINELPLTISPDGRYVAFTSLAGNVVAGDSNGTKATWAIAARPTSWWCTTP